MFYRILLLLLFSLSHSFASPDKIQLLTTLNKHHISTNQLIVKFKQSNSLSYATATKTLIKSLESASNVMFDDLKPMADGAFIAHINLTSLASFANTNSLSNEQLLSNIVKTINKLPNVEYAVKNRFGRIVPMPHSSSYNKVELTHALQWDQFLPKGGMFLESKPGLKDGAWSISQGQSPTNPVVVAVLDTGIEANSDLGDNVLTAEGWNFHANNRDVSDETASWHGTHVAGTIAASGSTVMGIGPQLNILPVKICGASGLFLESDVINAMQWSSGMDVPGVPKNTNPSRVFNMSFYMDNPDQTPVVGCDKALQSTINKLRRRGVVLVAAAANDNEPMKTAPQVCHGITTVAATGPTGLRSYFSNYGEKVLLAAPGGDKSLGLESGILSTVKSGKGYQGSGFDFYQGTSMASPHVAGVAGLILAVAETQGRYLSNRLVEKTLVATTHNFQHSEKPNNSCIGVKSCGHGIVNAFNALKATQAEYTAFHSAPAAAKLGLKANPSCDAGMYKPTRLNVTSPIGRWQADQNTIQCQTKESYLAPLIKISRNGFSAHYGKTVYHLNTKSNSECAVVGDNGIGCK